MSNLKKRLLKKASEEEINDRIITKDGIDIYVSSDLGNIEKYKNIRIVDSIQACMPGDNSLYVISNKDKVVIELLTRESQDLDMNTALDAITNTTRQSSKLAAVAKFLESDGYNVSTSSNSITLICKEDILILDFNNVNVNADAVLKYVNKFTLTDIEFIGDDEVMEIWANKLIV